MKKETRQDSFIRQPFYQGGDKALIEFVMKNLKYPKASLANKVEGDVHIRYDIDIKGNVTDVKIISGLDNHCNEEATRVVKLLKFVVPQNPRKLRITFHKKIRIHFSPQPIKVVASGMEDDITRDLMPASQPQGIQYNIIPTVKPEPVAAKPEPVSYTYTITIS
jgi:TonB family protein